MSRKKRKAPLRSKSDIYRLLRMYGVSKEFTDAILSDLIYYAVTEGNDLKYDRIYSGVALMLHRRYHLSGPEILEGLREFDAVCGSVLSDEETGEEGADWRDLMAELKEATGIVIHTGDDNRLICECEWKEEVYEEE